MKKIIITVVILLNATFFASCSNMTVGFEEDTKEQKSEIVTEIKVDKESENETSFSYTRDEE